MLMRSQNDFSSGPVYSRATGTPNSSRSLQPLSSKVSTVLSSSYADSDFKDSLRLLDSRGLQNSGQSRRHLRLDLQKEVISRNGDIIHEFGRVADQLQKIGMTLGYLNKTYAEMRAKIASAHTSTSLVLEEASSVGARRQRAEAKQQLFRSIQAQFVLSEDESARLTMATEPVDDSFFLTLNKAKQITKDCEILLGFEDQTLGNEIMEQTSKLLDQAFQKLYRWIQREFRGLDLENPQFGSRIRHALRVLAERPTLFRSCLNSFAEAREHLLSDSLFVALTGTSATGLEDPSVKPIELVAHDPLRYVGDILAWTHSAAVSEREALEVLFISEGDEIAKGIQAGRDREIWRLVEENDQEPAFDAVEALNDLVDRNVSSAARILRQRVEQVIQTNEEVILAYKLVNLLNFYRLTFAKLLSKQSVLVDSLFNLETEALRQFRGLMRDYISTVQAEFQQAPPNLEPPSFLQKALEQLADILRTFDTSLTSSASREADFQPILAEAFDPFIEGCRSMAKDMPRPSASMFLINCFQAARTTLSRYDFAEGKVTQLQDRIQEYSQALAEDQYHFFRDRSGLDTILQGTKTLTGSTEDLASMSSVPSLTLEQLAMASQTLDDFLPSALMDALENIKQLQDSATARRITEDAAERFCEDFEHLEGMMADADKLRTQEAIRAGHEDETHVLWRAAFPRTSGEIRVLLS